MRGGSTGHLEGLILFGALLLATPPLMAQQRVTRFGSAPVIDGVLDDAVWSAAVVLDGFVQTHPGDNTAPSAPTEVRIGFDARALYLSIRASDDPSLVRATVAARDEIRNDDFVELFLDTFGDRRRAYVLGFNPFGIQQDGLLTEGVTDPDYSVDVVMESRGRIDSAGWTVEAAIPLNSLRYAAGPGQQWSLQIQRRIKHRNDEQDSWKPLSRGASGFLTQAGRLEGFEELPSRRAVELYPSVTVLREGARVSGGGAGSPSPVDWREPNPHTEVGLTAKVGITPDVTAGLALNPDFAQVEADAPVVTANLRFPILFEEKRPFFLEGIELFRTPLLAVHTRTIVDPDAAIKMTGKRGASAFGALLAQDAAPARHQVGVLRLQREIGAASTIGVLGTGYRSDGRDNVTTGFDLRLAGHRTVATMQLLGTWSDRDFFDPDQGINVRRNGTGLGYYAQLRATGRHLNVTLLGRGWSPDYVSETGFTTQVNTNIWSLQTQWNSEPTPQNFLVSWSATNTVLGQFDWDGRPTYAYIYPRAEFSLPRQVTLSVGPYLDYLRLFEEEFGARRNASQAGAFAGAPSRETVYHGIVALFEGTPHRRLNFSGSVDWAWKVFDYDFGAGPRFPRVSPAALSDPGAPLDPGTGRTFDGSLSLQWRPTTVLRVSGSYTRSRFFRYDTRRVAYDENLWSGEVTYQLARFASLRLRTDYRSSRSNLRPQLLAAWTPNPGTSIYAGYNDDLSNNGFNPVTGAPERGLKRNARTAFVKMSYLVRWSW